MLDVFIGERRIKGQRQTAAIVVFGLRERRGRKAVTFRVKGMTIDRDVVDLAPDSLLSRSFVMNTVRVVRIAAKSNKAM